MEERAFLLHAPCSYTGDNELVVKKLMCNFHSSEYAA